MRFKINKVHYFTSFLPGKLAGYLLEYKTNHPVKFLRPKANDGKDGQNKIFSNVAWKSCQVGLDTVLQVYDTGIDNRLLTIKADFFIPT